MPTLSRSQKILFALLIIVVILAVWSSLPSGNQHNQQISGKLLSYSKADSQFRLDEASYSKLGSLQSAQESIIARSVYHSSPNALIPMLIRQLEKAAFKSDVHLMEIRPLTPQLVPGSNITSVPVQVRFTSPLQPNLVRFLFYIENPHGKIAVEQFNISSNEQNHSSGVTVSIQIAAYTLNGSILSQTASSGDQQNAASTQ